MATIIPFFQGSGDRSTLEELLALIEDIRPTEAMFCFAYVTLSGCVLLNRSLGVDFWRRTQTRWLTGIDYGRTEPEALRFLLDRPNAEVAVHDGASVLEQPGFRPSQDFHAKCSFAANPQHGSWGMLAGSGNLSTNGLTASIECGMRLTVQDEGQYNRLLVPSLDIAEALWRSATPASELLTAYSRVRVVPAQPRAPALADEKDPSQYRNFWIDPGYVTRNRGDHRPGNQIDMPIGVRRYFGFEQATARNEIIGEVAFITPAGRVIRNLRHGNNDMEKITLPIPERNGYGSYDGRILEFSRVDEGYRLEVLEIAEFEESLKTSLGPVYEMGSGRKYGFRD